MIYIYIIHIIVIFIILLLILSRKYVSPTLSNIPSQSIPEGCMYRTPTPWIYGNIVKNYCCMNKNIHI